MTKLSDRLEALAGKATKGPWKAGGLFSKACIYNADDWLIARTDIVHANNEDVAWHDNAAMIVELVNNLPTILQALKARGL